LYKFELPNLNDEKDRIVAISSLIDDDVRDSFSSYENAYATALVSKFDSAISSINAAISLDDYDFIDFPVFSDKKELDNSLHTSLPSDNIHVFKKMSDLQYVDKDLYSRLNYLMNRYKLLLVHSLDNDVDNIDIIKKYKTKLVNLINSFLFIKNSSESIEPAE